MVLLSASTVSSIISVGIIVVFTVLLFLSGYVLQQQSVRSIQYAIRPPDSDTSIHRSPNQHNLRRKSYYDESYGDDTSSGNGYYAYLQLLSHPDPSNICSAILFFKNLASNNTAIQDRLFMYPEEWDRLASKKQSKDVSSALSLLHSASTKYKIWLLPIDMTAATSSGYTTTDTKVLRLGQVQFMQYDAVLYLQTPGLVVDTGKVDDILLSRPLPGRYDPDRLESFDNKAWTPMPLKAEREAKIPPVYLITVNNIGHGQVEARGHVPNTALPGFGHLAAGPQDVKSAWTSGLDPAEDPGYVLFEHDKNGDVRWDGNPVFGSWRKQQNEVCKGLDLDAIHDDDHDL